MANDVAITVRVPAKLKQRLVQRAKRERRSISAQVLHELERAVSGEPDEATAERPAVGLFEGYRLPSDEDLRKVRSLLWSRVGRRRG